MNLPPPLARLMAVVIVMIAAVFGASAAQAHEGHAHHQVPTAVPHHAQTAPVAVPAQAVQAAAVTTRQVIAAPPVSQRLQLASARLGTPNDSRPCHGVCCSMGAACCAAGDLPPVSTVGLSAPSLAARLTASAEPFVAGIAREALPKPPRSFA